MREIAFPAEVFGPVDFRAFCLFASSCAAEFGIRPPTRTPSGLWTLLLSYFITFLLLRPDLARAAGRTPKVPQSQRGKPEAFPSAQLAEIPTFTNRRDRQRIPVFACSQAKPPVIRLFYQAANAAAVIVAARSPRSGRPGSRRRPQGWTAARRRRTPRRASDGRADSPTAARMSAAPAHDRADADLERGDASGGGLDMRRDLRAGLRHQGQGQAPSPDVRGLASPGASWTRAR